MDHRHFNSPGIILKNLQWTFTLWSRTSNPFFLISLRSSISGIASLTAYDNPVYSASVVLSEISVWSWDFDTIGQPAYIMMYPCLDRTESTSLSYFLCQFPQKLLSTNTSNDLVRSGLKMRPLLGVPSKYRPIHQTASPCSLRGSVDYCAHWRIVYASSDRDPFLRYFILPMTLR